jgi:hypothetical protein
LTCHIYLPSVRRKLVLLVGAVPCSLCLQTNGLVFYGSRYF